MKSAILMGSVAAVALAMPAFAGPDRLDGADCSGMGGAARTDCVHQQVLGGDVNNQSESKATTEQTLGAGFPNGNALSASRSLDNDSDLGDEIGDTANDVAQDTGEAAQDVGAAAVHAANEAGDTLGEAANDVGDTISNAAGDVADAF